MHLSKIHPLVADFQAFAVVEIGEESVLFNHYSLPLVPMNITPGLMEEGKPKGNFPYHMGEGSGSSFDFRTPFPFIKSKLFSAFMGHLPPSLKSKKQYIPLL